MPPLFLVGPDGAKAELVNYRVRGATMIVAVQRDFAQPAADEAVVLTLPKPGTVSDLRHSRSLGRNQRVTVTLDAVSPAVLSIAP